MTKHEHVSGDVVAIERYKVDGGYVEVGLSYTKNLGNFESLKLNVALGRPLRNGESPIDAVDKVYAVVGEALGTKLQEAMRELGLE